MKITLTLCLLLLTVSAVSAGTIVDLQTGSYAIGAEVTVTGAVVSGVRYNGFFMTEQNNVPYAGVWVYTGTAPGVASGDLVDVKGLYEEYFDFTEINVTTDLTGYVTVTGSHQGIIYPMDVTIADLIANGEPYESCFIRVLDGMTVISPPTLVPNTYGEWVVESWDNPGQTLVFDDYWYDDTTVLEGDCYLWATGILNFGFGVFKLEPFADGICHADCVVSTDDMSFDQVKSLFR